MTAPRQVLPGVTYLVTRRCAQRQFLLRPSEETSGIFLYVLALASRRFGILVHAFCVLSNHYHLVVTDPHARLPAFGQYLDSLVARAVNAALGRWESFWAPASYSAVALSGPGDVIAKTAYVLANPVAAGLVAAGRDWPGLWTAPEQLGTGKLIVRRPSTFFRQEGGLPETIELELTPPPGVDSVEGFQREVAQAFHALEVQAHRTLGDQGRGFLGGARVLTQRPSGRPRAKEPRRELRPRVAGRETWKRTEALSRLVEFARAYRRAWAARRAGELAAVFPAGTYLLRVLHGAPCAAPA